MKNSNFLDLPGWMKSYIGVSIRLMQVPLQYWQALKNSLWLTDAQNIRNVFIHSWPHMTTSNTDGLFMVDLQHVQI